MTDEVSNRTTLAPAPNHIEHQTSWLFFFLKIVVAILTAPYRRTFKLYTWQLLKDIRAAGADRKALIPLVRDFKTDKYAELQSVQVAASFCAGATLATLSWSRNKSSIWVADALFFSSLMCSIWAVITSIQTKSILDDLPNKDQMTCSLPEFEVKRIRRTILRYKKTPGIQHWMMVFVWQFPSMTMAYAWTTFLAGLTVYMCTPFFDRIAWGTQAKISIVYLCVGFIGLVTYILSTVFVYVGERDLERSVASTRVNSSQLEAGIGSNTAGLQPETRRTEHSSTSGEGSLHTAQAPRAGLFDGGPVIESRRESQRSGRSKGHILI